MFQTQSFLFVLLVSTISCLKLPDYITPCKANDPNLNQCAYEQAQQVFPHIINGDKEFKIPNLNPLKLPFVELVGSNLHLVFRDIVASGIPEGQVKALNIDLANKRWEFHFLANNINLLSKYEVKGKILVLPIEGQGQANITLAGGDYKYHFDWEEVTGADGKIHMKIVKASLTFNLEHAYFDMENLFQGNKNLAIDMNKFLNENWKECIRDIGTPVTNSLEAVITSIIRGYLEQIPFEEIFV